MTNRQICMTEQDKTRLEDLLESTKDAGGRIRKELELLAHEVARAEVVPSQAISRDVVTMNSRVVLQDLDTKERMTFTLVFPQKANVEEGAMSVLAPVGTAILGYRKGDVVEWPVPAGVRRLQIADVLYQPEAAGDFHL